MVHWIHFAVGAGVVAGLGYTWQAAWRGDVLAAVAGSAATLAFLTAGALWGMSLRLGVTLMRTRRQTARLERRQANAIDVKTANSQRHTELVAELNHTRRQLDRGDRELANRINDGQARLAQRLESLLTRMETFCNLRDDQLNRLERRMTELEASLRRGLAPPDVARLDGVIGADWAAPDAPPGEGTMAAYQHLVDSEPAAADGGRRAKGSNSEKRRLREEFARLIHERQYTEALAKGDELQRRFPNSTTASDFRRVRPHLVRRIELASRAVRS